MELLTPLKNPLPPRLTVLRTVRHLQLGHLITITNWGLLSMSIYRIFKEKHPNEETTVVKHKRIFGKGKAKKNCICYPPSFEQEIIKLITDLLNKKTAIKPYPTEEHQVKPTVVSEPATYKRPRITKKVLEKVEPIRFSPAALLKNRGAK